MAKSIFSAAGGAIALTEDAGVFTLALSDAAAVGGGQAAGIVKVQGSGSVVLDAQTGLKLAEALLNAHLPATVQPLAAVVESIANQAIAALE
jgi:hypothetical protein